jgi:hypothetical protein
VATIHEPARELPVIHEADLCVLGGSCTGLFAAVRAARLGASVAVVERAGCFGGVATISLVNVWHSKFDTEYRRQIFGGLTVEVMERLKQRGAVTERGESPAWHWSFVPGELTCELDELVVEHGITPFLHTPFVAPHVEDDELRAVILETPSGRAAIRARMFIDATGDGTLCHRLGLPTYVHEHLQPATTCAVFGGWESLGGHDLNALRIQYGGEFGLPEGFVWGARLPGSEAYMMAGTRVYHADCSQGAALTAAEMEGRRQVRAFMDLVRAKVPDQHLSLLALPARIGIRETRHVKARYQLTGEDVLHGRRFDDAIANGSYRVDIHHQDKPGITFQYLDGTQVYARPGYPSETSRWRAETPDNPTFYQIPYRCLVPGGYDNLLVAGRMIDADVPAHAAIRVMVNMNQTGEAAGVAAVLAMRAGKAVGELDAGQVRRELAAGGSVVI